MLSSLHIRNYILIDSLDIEFPEGLVIVTGQTGAGKSIILGALSLLSGARADVSVIKEGADNCAVEAEFSQAPEDLREIVEENGLEWNGGRLTIRRVLSSSGRSRCFVNDCPASMPLLQTLADRLVDIHSQHRSLIITDKAFQLSVLDLFSGNSGTLEECRESWRRLRSHENELIALKSRLERMNAEADYNSARFGQLDGAGLRPGELEELELEHKSLAASGQIKEALASSLAFFNPSSGESPDMLASLKSIRQALESAGKYIPSISGLASRVESVRVELDDIRAELEDADSRLDLSPDRLNAVEERLSLLYTLMKRFSCSDVESLITERETLRTRVDGIGEVQEEICALELRISEEKKVYEALAVRLGASRRKSAAPFAAAIQDNLRFLELEGAVFSVEVADAPDSASGRDSVRFLFSANGTAPEDLSKCASGGELSRIMLCLKEMMARFTGMPTLVFDEIDAGVSGSVADKMGQMVCRMGANMQVFSITHLPQVAAKGDSHFIVSKTERDGHISSTISRCSGRERVLEIARLLSGAHITETAIANAETLLQGS